MDPGNSLLTFGEARSGLPFGLVLATGVILAGAMFLLRPWPPRARRAALFAGIVAICAPALVYLLLERRLVIDPADRTVELSRQALGVGPARRWSFGEIGAVAVRRVPHDGGARPWFELGLDASGDWIELRRFDEVLAAEDQARRIARLGGWTALRRGYRLDTNARAAEPESFETAQGKRGLVFDFGSLVRVTEAPGEESAIEPAP